jgi:hypothetical protein
VEQLPDKHKAVSVINSKELLRVPAKDALALILDSPRPVTLVQSLAEEDLFWLVQGIGPEDALPILSLASNDQWQYLLDLELWTKDRLEYDSVNRWLSLLLKADPERFMIWGLGEHIELLELHLLEHVDVRIRQEDESPSDFEEGFFSPDGLFYVRIKNDKYEQTSREFLQRLAHHDLDRFHQVLLELGGFVPAEVEENLYRLRNVRLAEKGFLPFEEAVGIYQHMQPETLLDRQSHLRKVVEEEPPDQPVPVSTSLLVPDQNAFHMCLQHINDVNALQRLQIEFAAMCNRIISADVLVVRDQEQLATVVRKACGYLSIGLDRMTGGDLQKAASLVRRVSLTDIFRVGYGAALELRWDTEKWLKKSWFIKQGFGLGFWGDAWEGILEGLLKKRPLFYAAYSEGEPYREFTTLEEIRHCQTVLHEIVAVDHFLSLVFSQSFPAHRLPAYQPVTYKNLVLTLWARHHLGLPEGVTPLGDEEAKTFFLNLWETGPRPHRVSSQMKRAFMDWLQLRSGCGPNEIVRTVGRSLDHLFGELEQEYGSVDLKAFDPRYMKHLLVVP